MFWSFGRTGEFEAGSEDVNRNLGGWGGGGLCSVAAIVNLGIGVDSQLETEAGISRATKANGGAPLVLLNASRNWRIFSKVGTGLAIALD